MTANVTRATTPTPSSPAALPCRVVLVPAPAPVRTPAPALGSHGLTIDMLERMLEQQPRGPTVWSAPGALLRQVGKPEEAIACRRRALEIDQRHVGAWTNLGR